MRALEGLCAPPPTSNATRMKHNNADQALTCPRVPFLPYVIFWTQIYIINMETKKRRSSKFLTPTLCWRKEKENEKIC